MFHGSELRIVTLIEKLVRDKISNWEHPQFVDGNL